MAIEHITIKHCPTCQRGVRAASFYERHTNGNWNEIVEFMCGAIWHFSPNFMTTTNTQLCKYGGESRTTEIELRRLENEVTQKIQESTLPTRSKAALIQTIANWKFYG